MDNYNRFQRVGSPSNARVGDDFEATAQAVLATQGISVSRDFAVSLGVGERKKVHRFDLGAQDPPVLVECKSHKWTVGGNVPSAKMTVWNEVMLYFTAAPQGFRKILFVLRDERAPGRETLAGYYMRTYAHLVPDGVEIWEFDAESGTLDVLTRKRDADGV